MLPTCMAWFIPDLWILRREWPRFMQNSNRVSSGPALEPCVIGRRFCLLDFQTQSKLVESKFIAPSVVKSTYPNLSNSILMVLILGQASLITSCSTTERRSFYRQRLISTNRKLKDLRLLAREGQNFIIHQSMTYERRSNNLYLSTSLN